MITDSAVRQIHKDRTAIGTRSVLDFDDNDRGTYWGGTDNVMVADAWCCQRAFMGQ